ncbi:MAG: hypothetical protein JWR81_930 [Pseudonocardia sp.]|nr:hypothetical protein [Pseudonocardia sp.]MDT7612567.1 hypothetical protein [Pseudonocardiales bacterium]
MHRVRRRAGGCALTTATASRGGGGRTGSGVPARHEGAAPGRSPRAPHRHAHGAGRPRAQRAARRASPDAARRRGAHRGHAAHDGPSRARLRDARRSDDCGRERAGGRRSRRARCGGSAREAEAYAAAQSARTGCAAVDVRARMRLFAAGELRPPTDVQGAARRASPADAPLPGAWRHAPRWRRTTPTRIRRRPRRSSRGRSPGERARRCGRWTAFRCRRRPRDRGWPAVPDRSGLNTARSSTHRRSTAATATAPR